ncbi:MAG: DUF998 domain-containing protein [Candidatus Kariarchaeaceae archaeon]
MNKKVILSYVILSGFVVYIIGSSISILIHPNYSFTSQYFSDLGVGRFGFIFNLTLILTGLLLFPFFPLAYYLINPNNKARIMLIISATTGILSSIFLVFVGVFNKSEDSIRIHNFFATGFFLLMLVTTIFWVIGHYFLPEKDQQVKRSEAIIKIIYSILIILIPLIFVIVTRTFDPLLQKITVYSFIGYFGLSAHRLVYSKEAEY